MEIVYAAPGKLLRMTGALGPFQPLAAIGSMSIQLSPAAPGGTDLQVTYTVAGRNPVVSTSARRSPIQ
jgi:hypothetical protein